MSARSLPFLALFDSNADLFEVMNDDQLDTLTGARFALSGPFTSDDMRMSPINRDAMLAMWRNEPRRRKDAMRRRCASLTADQIGFESTA